MWFFLVVSLPFISALNCDARFSISDDRIYNIDHVPFTVSLQYEIGDTYVHNCAGSIISKKHVLTTAQCKPADELIDKYVIRAGSSFVNSGGKIYRVAKFVLHDKFVKLSNDYDYGIAFLPDDEEFEFGKSIRPIKPANEKEFKQLRSDTQMVTSGWGRSTEQDMSSVSMIVQLNKLNMLKRSNCNDVYIFMTDRQICFSAFNPPTTTGCYGGYGNPATLDGIQYGSVSSELKCSTPSIPGMLSKTSIAYDWIQKITGLSF